MGGNKRWSATELELLEKKYGLVDIDILAAELGRSIDSVHWKASQMNLRFSKNKDVNILVAILEKLESIEEKISNLNNRIGGIKHSVANHWKLSEIEYLRDSYGKKTTKEISDHLGRSIPSIHQKGIHLGLSAPMGRREEEIRSLLTEKQEQYLIDNFHKKSFAVLLGSLPISSTDLKKAIRFLKKNGKIQNKPRGNSNKKAIESILSPAQQKYLVRHYYDKTYKQIISHLQLTESEYRSAVRILKNNGVLSNKKTRRK